jgi:dolichyl-phosphate-mannose--protein O-mannosyl transferase
MDWHRLTHGWNALLFVILLIALPLSFAMVQCRAPLRRWLALPPAVVVLMIVLGLVFSFLIPVLAGMTGRRDEDDPVLLAIAVGISLVTGYVVGRRLS